jgi:hypothetical protein
MNQKHLTQIWQWMSLACVLFILTSLISIQGGSEYIGRLLGDKGTSLALPDTKPAIGYFGAIIGGGLLLFASWALALHALRYGGSWHDRIPVVWLEGLKTSAWEGMLFQAIVLVLFVGLPAVGISLCIAEAERGDICEQDTSRAYKGSDTTLLWPPKAVDPKNQMRLRREGSDQDPCTAGIEILPTFWTPVLVYGLPTAAYLMALFALGAVFVAPPAPAASANGETRS